MEVSELVGLKSLYALQAYGKIILGLKMLPMYMAHDYSEFFKKVEEMSPADQEKIIRQGVFLVDLEDEEVGNLVRFCKDANGVPYSVENMKKIKAETIYEILVTVCLEIAKIKPQLLTGDEKKN